MQRITHQAAARDGGPVVLRPIRATPCLSGVSCACRNSKKVFLVTVVKLGIAMKSHTRTVVRECCKDDDQSQWKRPKFDPPPPLNPLTDRHQNLPT